MTTIVVFAYAIAKQFIILSNSIHLLHICISELDLPGITGFRKANFLIRL